MIEAKEFLNIHEARAFLGVSRSFLYKNKGSIQAYALGRKTYFRKSDLEGLFIPKEIERPPKESK